MGKGEKGGGWNKREFGPRKHIHSIPARGKGSEGREGRSRKVTRHYQARRGAKRRERQIKKENGRKVTFFSFFPFSPSFSANRFDDLRFFALDNAPFEIPNVLLELLLLHRRRGVMNIIWDKNFSYFDGEKGSKVHSTGHFYADVEARRCVPLQPASNFPKNP